MKDLVYNVAKGEPMCIRDGIVQKSVDTSDKHFNVYIHGSCLNVGVEPKSPLFRVRNLNAVASCYFLGLERDKVRDVASNNALCVAESIDKSLLENPIIVIEGITFDCSDEERKEILENLYTILYSISLTYIHKETPVVYWDLYEEELKSFSNGIDWGCNCDILDNDDYRCLVLHL